MSRHRGAKHRRRYELLGGISLLSPEYLLAVTLAVKPAYAIALTS